MSGLGAMQQGKYEAQIAERNASMSTEAARDSIDRGRDEAKQFYRHVGQLKGEQTAAMAANGIDVGSGTALRVQQDTAMMANEDASNLYRNIHERTRGFDIQASNYRAEGEAAKSKGKAAFVSSIFEAGGSLMSGFSQAKGLKAKFGTGG